MAYFFLRSVTFTCPKCYLFAIFLVPFNERFFLYGFLLNEKGFYHIQVLFKTYINSWISVLYYHQDSQLMASQMEVTQVDQYESDEDVIENNDSIKEVKKVHRKRRTKFWIEDKTFETPLYTSSWFRFDSSKRFESI